MIREALIEELFLAGRFADSVDCCLTWLEEKRRTDPNLHKGHRFYFLGIAAFASHDYQSATFFFDAAALEDLRDPEIAQDRPALLFMCLDDNRQEQAALEIVKLIVEKLRKAIDEYTTRPGKSALTHDDVRKHFLRHLVFGRENHRRTLATTFISFLAEWNYRSQMIDLCEAGSREPFFTHLFRGCLLFESLLKGSAEPQPDKRHPTLGDFLNDEHFKRLLGIEKIATSCDDFDALVRSLIENEPVPMAIQCAAQVRNTLGHNLVWATQSLDRKSYELLANNIASSCLHAISALYVTRSPPCM
jgi:hypothetical protein